MERAVLNASGAQITQLDFGIPLDAPTGVPAANQTLDAAEQDMIRSALERCAGNIQKTAEMLGLSRAALYRRLEKFGIRTAE
jgi:transcriptional regulator of acetoin/glycerol metabolism